MSENRYHSIANKLVLYIVFPVFLLTLLLGVGVGWYEYSRESGLLEEYHTHRQKQLGSLLAEPISFFEYEIVSTIARTASDSKDIDFIQIRDRLNNTIVEYGERPPKTRELRIVYTPTDEENVKEGVVGVIEIGFFDENLDRVFLRSYLESFIIIILAGILLVFMIYTAWKRVVVKPLEQLRMTMESNTGESDCYVNLQSNDEFKLIASAYNNMLDRVALHRNQIKQRDALFRMLYHQTPALMLSFNKSGKILRVSKYLCGHLGYSEEELVNKSILSLLVQSTEEGDLLKDIESLSIPLEILHANGNVSLCLLRVVVEPNDNNIYLGVLNDVTAELEANKKLIYLANHDQLTGLLNQRAFASKVNELIVRKEKEYWFLFIDLDRFKWINDTYGHLSGDNILKVIASRLQASIPDSLLGRFGGDEFVAFVQGGEYSIAELLNNIKLLTSKRIIIPLAELTPSVCIGAAKYPDDATQYEELLQKADAAMYRAKILGRNMDFIYNNFLDDINKQQIRVIEILQKFIMEDNIDVYFQPIIDIRSNELVSAEALMRIVSINSAELPINLFLQVAEESGYIRRVDRLARHKAMSYLSRWRMKQLPITELHINVSALNFNSDDFVSDIINDLKTFNLSGCDVILEITESALISNPDKAIAQLKELRSIGIRIALDDFGTGYSSLSMLTSFPVDILKLDQSFFLGENSNSKRLIVNHLIAMANSLKMTVIAEGIELNTVSTWLKEINCHYLQGFLFSRPIPAKEFEQIFLKSQGGGLDHFLPKISTNKNPIIAPPTWAK